VDDANNDLKQQATTRVLDDVVDVVSPIIDQQFDYDGTMYKYALLLNVVSFKLQQLLVNNRMIMKSWIEKRELLEWLKEELKDDAK
jgi:hypothetical protein